MPRVLVVDDDRTIRDLLTFALELEGYDVLAAADGLHALDLLLDLREPCVVLLDLMMPHLDGLQVCRRLAATPHAAAHRLVLMSAALSPDEPCPAEVCALLRKPFELEQVFALVAQLQAELLPPTALGSEGGALPLAG